MKKSPILFVLLLCGQQALGYVTGYSQLYNPSSNQTIDILYDIHWPSSLSYWDFELPVRDIKPRLHKTERFVLKVFEDLDASNQAFNTAIIAESGGDYYFSDVFLGHINRLVSQRMRNMTFVKADTFRYALAGNESIRIPYSVKPRLNAWHDLYHRYAEYYLHDLDPAKRSVIYAKIIFGGNLEDFHKLADIEMLWHILTVRHQRIIVYCGAAHAFRIRQFLLKHAAYKETHGYHTCFTEDFSVPARIENFPEMPLRALQPLADCLDNGSQHKKGKKKRQKKSGQPRFSKRNHKR